MKFKNPKKVFQTDKILICKTLVALCIPYKKKKYPAYSIKFFAAIYEHGEYREFFTGAKMVDDQKEMVATGYETLHIKQMEPLSNRIDKKFITKEELFWILLHLESAYDHGAKQ